MPRKDTKEYRAYMREYMRAKRRGLTGINTSLMVGDTGLEPVTSAMICKRFFLNWIKILGSCGR